MPIETTGLVWTDDQNTVLKLASLTASSFSLLGSLCIIVAYLRVRWREWRDTFEDFEDRQLRRARASIQQDDSSPRVTPQHLGGASFDRLVFILALNYFCLAVVWIVTVPLQGLFDVTCQIGGPLKFFLYIASVMWSSFIATDLVRSLLRAQSF